MPSFQVLRKLIIGFFLTLIAWQSGVLSIYTVIQIQKHRYAVKQVLKDAIKSGLYDQQLITFSKTDLKNARWEHDKEFFLNYNKYDVVRMQKTDRGILYICILDSKEIVLYKALDKHKMQNDVLKELLKKLNIIQDNISESSKIGLANNQEILTFINLNYHFNCFNSLFRPPIFQA